MNRRLAAIQPYPTVRLDERKAAVRAKGLHLYDFGTGDPNEPTPEFIRAALRDNVPTSSTYTSVHGSDELREAAAGYVERRFGVALDPAREVLATAGSMEAIFHMPMVLVHDEDPRDLVVYGEPAYRVFELGALYAGAEPHGHRLGPDNDYLLRPADLGEDELARTALVYLNYPHNPSGATMPGEVYAAWVEARDRHGFALVSDECYCDL
ncbi:MAG: aminotransferase class I/II-fold pyridoxal phosphate-dependent enzyme [Planctomycetota bacterium]